MNLFHGWGDAIRTSRNILPSSFRTRSILAYSSPLSKLLFSPGYGRNVPANTCQASSDLATRLRMM